MWWDELVASRAVAGAPLCCGLYAALVAACVAKNLP
eukprot:gene5474-21580_t